MIVEELIFRKSPDLLRTAQAVFGEVVTEAWVSTWFFTGQTNESEALKRLDGQAESCWWLREATEVALDPGVVMLSFSGRLVRISVSEWGSISVHSGPIVEM